MALVLALALVFGGVAVDVLTWGTPVTLAAAVLARRLPTALLGAAVGTVVGAALALAADGPGGAPPERLAPMAVGQVLLAVLAHAVVRAAREPGGRGRWLKAAAFGAGFR